ncbi:hypothetical protein B484DRAFT_455606 [Ochromonadaceae sp. CCMP2298]|nr:hypothetical protein B484DRAFT_455606 [Ochromonadaceae sp. CCMP2298]
MGGLTCRIGAAATCFRCRQAYLGTYNLRRVSKQALVASPQRIRKIDSVGTVLYRLIIWLVERPKSSCRSTSTTNFSRLNSPLRDSCWSSKDADPRQR